MSAHWIRPDAAVLLASWIALAGLGGCASSSEKFSFLDGERWSQVEMDTYDTTILSVDGKSYTYNSRIKVEPGRHQIVFQTRPVFGFSYSPQKTLEVDVEPCVRYWFEAKRANGLQQDFEPRVNYKQPIAGCGAAASASS
jgi:hypothetical protein